MPKFETVLYETRGPICSIVLNRPEKLNAATDQLVEDVNDALFEFDADESLHVAIISGAGRAFCSGRARLRAGARLLAVPVVRSRGRRGGDEVSDS